MSRIGTLGLAAAGRLVRMPPVPDIPQGRVVDLPGRGSTYVVDTGPVPSGRGGDASTVFLLHALACTGVLTWYPCLDELRRRYRVVIPDLRWHGQGIRSARFELEDCADDVVAVADALGIDRFVSAGYSMGSLVAQLAAHRHPDRVAGIVLAASTACFAPTPRRSTAVRAAGGRLAAFAGRQRRLAVSVLDQSPDNRWAWRQFRATTGAETATAGAIIARFDSRPWLASLDLPAAVVVTTRDRLIPPAAQRALARRIRNATAYDAVTGHGGCVLGAEQFRPAMLAATGSVTGRISRETTA